MVGVLGERKSGPKFKSGPWSECGQERFPEGNHEFLSDFPNLVLSQNRKGNASNDPPMVHKNDTFSRLMTGKPADRNDFRKEMMNFFQVFQIRPKSKIPTETDQNGPQK